MPCSAPLPWQTNRAAAYVAGWFAGACSDTWPKTPDDLAPLIERVWALGVYNGRMARIEARQVRR